MSAIACATGHLLCSAMQSYLAEQQSSHEFRHVQCLDATAVHWVQKIPFGAF